MWAWTWMDNSQYTKSKLNPKRFHTTPLLLNSSSNSNPNNLGLGENGLKIMSQYFRPCCDNTL